MQIKLNLQGTNDLLLCIWFFLEGSGGIGRILCGTCGGGSMRMVGSHSPGGRTVELSTNSYKNTDFKDILVSYIYVQYNATCTSR